MRCAVSTLFVAIFLLCHPAVAQDRNIVDLLPLELPRTSIVVTSRNGSAVAASTEDRVVLVTNFLQFDQQVHPLGPAVRPSDVMAVSYYGRVYARSLLGSDCAVRVFDTNGGLLFTAQVSDDPGCEIVSGVANVAERFAFRTREKSGRERLLLLEPDRTITTIHETDSVNQRDIRVESFALNDLNTLVYTVSSPSAGRRRIFQTFVLVPGRSAVELILPRRTRRDGVVRDINNRNQFLVHSRRREWVFDATRNALIRSGRGSERLTPTGTGYSKRHLSTRGSLSLRVRCLRTGTLSGGRLELLAVNEERELIVVHRKRSGSTLAKIIPLTDDGYPTCF